MVAMVDAVKSRGISLQGVKDVLREVNRDATFCVKQKATRAFTLEVTSANGVLSCVQIESDFTWPVEDGRDAIEVTSEFISELESMASPNCHRVLTLYLVIVLGEMSARTSDARKHRFV